MDKFDYERTKKYFDSMPIAFTIIELILNGKLEPVDFIFRYANAELARLEGYDLDAMINHSFYNDIFPEIHDRKWLKFYYSSACLGKNQELHEFSVEIGRYLKIVCYPWSVPRYCACVLTDETELVEAQKRLNFLAGYDAATQVQNRNSYVDFCGNFRTGGSAGVIFVDVNNLKLTNDTYGHDTGDFLLQLVVDRINARFAKEECKVFRIGGDEFVIVLEDVGENICEEKAMALHRDLFNDEIVHLPRILASLGWSWSARVSDFEELVREADARMYTAKQEDKAV